MIVTIEGKVIRRWETAKGRFVRVLCENPDKSADVVLVKVNGALPPLGSLFKGQGQANVRFVEVS